MLPSQNRLRRSSDVQSVRLEGRRRQHPLLLLFTKARPQAESSTSRFAIVAGRRVGKAARRNRVKRQLREIIRGHLDGVKPGYDFLLVARTAASSARYDELEIAVLHLLERSGVWMAGDGAEVDHQRSLT